MNNVIEIAGWLGVLLILGAYGLNVSEVLAQNSLVYLLMNLTGATLTGWNLFTKKAYAVFFLELAWGAISIFGIIQVYIP